MLISLAKFWITSVNNTWIFLLGLLPIPNFALLLLFNLGLVNEKTLVFQTHFCNCFIVLYLIADSIFFPFTNYAKQNKEMCKQIVVHHIASIFIGVSNELITLQLFGNTFVYINLYLFTVNMFMELSNFLIRLYGPQIGKSKFLSRMFIYSRCAIEIYLICYSLYLAFLEVFNKQFIVPILWLVTNFSSFVLLNFQIVYIPRLWKPKGYLHKDS